MINVALGKNEVAVGVQGRKTFLKGSMEGFIECI